MNVTHDIEKTKEIVKKQSLILQRLLQEIRKVIVGQESILERMLICLVANGHMLLEGVPGLAKTMAVQTFARALGLKFQRISFTPDLLPADLIGTLVYNPKDSSFIPHLGPIFANFLLADEINRAPAKVQSALLEAMQERRVTIGETTYKLPHPFVVMATQNPIEQEGTYPLPEAQIDRFMMKCRIEYPSREEERKIMELFSTQSSPSIEKAIVTSEEITTLRETLDLIYCDEKIGEYILDIVFATRHGISSAGNLAMDISRLVEYGASPRATLYLNLSARALALIRGRAHVIPQDVKDIAPDVLRHRLILTYEAEAENITTDKVIQYILKELPVP